MSLTTKCQLVSPRSKQDKQHHFSFSLAKPPFSSLALSLSPSPSLLPLSLSLSLSKTPSQSIPSYLFSPSQSSFSSTLRLSHPILSLRLILISPFPSPFRTSSIHHDF